MKSILKSIILTGLFIFLQLIVFAQETDKTVSITVSGSGKTQEQAKQAALRSAIEQAFGTFISSKTEIFNDQVVADEIASVANGNIQSFTILNESQLPDSSWGVTLKALVSVSKLSSFVQAKGVAIEIKGGLFALNIKQQLLNEQGEINAVCEMVGLLHEPMQTSFDFELNSGNPTSIDEESETWEIPIYVTAITNKNIDFCAKYCIKTLSALSLSLEEVASYRNLNKPVYTIIINYKDFSNKFYLRTQRSIDAINTFTSQWEYYTRLFTVQTGIDERFGGKQNWIYKFEEIQENKIKKINFPQLGNPVAKFTYKDKRKLEEIEKMSGYTIKPRGVVSKFKHGGYVFYEENGHGLVVSLVDSKLMDWNSAKTACNELVLNGYNDWFLPSKEEFNLIYENLILSGIGGFEKYVNYWTSTTVDNDNEESAWTNNLQGGNQYTWYINKDWKFNARAIRAF